MKERRKKLETVFIHGKQVRVKREPTIDGIPVSQFIEKNADPLWLHQNGLWELIPVEDPLAGNDACAESRTEEDEIPS